ncbi:MAG: NAD(P)-dependent oxidoreductase [Fusicatenibacter sp.]
MKIGFIGIGIMGTPMSKNLLNKSGYPVMVYDLNQAAVNELVQAGAQKADSAQEIADNCQIIFTMLPRNEHVDSVYHQLLPHMIPGQIFVDMSTISPSVSRKWAATVKEKKAFFLDAPVVKSKPAAISGTLGIYVGGDHDKYLEILPLLQCMGSKILYLGDNGAGLVMKLCHNLLVAQIQNGVNETLTLAKKSAGIDPLLFQEATTCGGAQNFYLDSKAAVIDALDFTTAFSAEYMHKDLFLAKDLCKENGLSFPGVDLVTERYDEVLENGWGKEDFSCTYKLFEDKES